MKILIACEYSGAVRRAFVKLGHHVTSCDFLPTEIPCEGPNEWHYQGDLGHCLSETVNSFTPFDMVIAFPPCTHLAVSGARWFKDKKKEQEDAIFFFKWIANLPIPRIAIENPIGIMSTHYRKPDQIIQPWQFGHGETKATCLWLKGLPKLVPTNIVEGRHGRVWRMAPGPNRAKERSRTYQGIADAMAEQWGCLDHEYKGQKIRTNFDYPPIPVRNLDWSAVFDSYDGSEDSRDPIGHGATEREAVADLIQQAEC